MPATPMNNDRAYQPPVRVSRSVLAVPASRTEYFEKAANSETDTILFDLEDSVTHEQKESARINVIQALRDIDYQNKTLSLRVNGLDTPYMYRDLVDIMESDDEKLDLLMIPKVDEAADVYAVEKFVSQMERAGKKRKMLGFELQIETAAGMQNVDEIAKASPRTESLHFGVADYAASLNMRTTNIGGPLDEYAVLDIADNGSRRSAHLNDAWHYPLNRILVAARANGLRAIDGPFGNLSDKQGLIADAARVAAMGFDGKMALTPNQVSDINATFTPTQEAIDYARQILAALSEAQSKGDGAVSLDGRFIDMASIRQAEKLLEVTEKIKDGFSK